MLDIYQLSGSVSTQLACLTRFVSQQEALNARAGAWAGEKARPPIEVVTELVEKVLFS